MQKKKHRSPFFYMAHFRSRDVRHVEQSSFFYQLNFLRVTKLTMGIIILLYTCYVTFSIRF